MEKSSMTSYALTLTLKPKFRMRKGVNMLAPWQYDMSHEKVLDLLNCINVTLRTVIAELTKSGDVHYHGVINSEEDHRGLQYNLACAIKQSDVFGFFTVKEIDDIDGWIEYITKDCLSTHALLGRPSLICDDLNLIECSEFKATPL